MTRPRSFSANPSHIEKRGAWPFGRNWSWRVEGPGLLGPMNNPYMLRTRVETGTALTKNGALRAAERAAASWPRLINNEYIVPRPKISVEHA